MQCKNVALKKFTTDHLGVAHTIESAAKLSFLVDVVCFANQQTTQTAIGKTEDPNKFILEKFIHDDCRKLPCIAVHAGLDILGGMFTTIVSPNSFDCMILVDNCKHGDDCDKNHCFPGRHAPLGNSKQVFRQGDREMADRVSKNTEVLGGLVQCLEKIVESPVAKRKLEQLCESLPETTEVFGPNTMPHQQSSKAVQRPKKKQKEATSGDKSKKSKGTGGKNKQTKKPWMSLQTALSFVQNSKKTTFNCPVKVSV